MPNGQPASPTNPFRVFISHKVGGHGRAAENIKRELENYAKGVLEICVSPALGPGIKWQPELLQEIERADLFILLYLVEGIDMDWCLYEAGYFERQTTQTRRKLICMVKEGCDLPGPLAERQRLEATSSGVKKLLRAIYYDEDKPVRPDLFDTDSVKTLSQLTEFILKLLQPFKKEALCPRLWITVGGPESLEQLKNGTLPGEARLSGEAEALKQLGLRAGEEITLADFRSRSEFQFALTCYVPHLANCLRRIVERYPDLWVIPPVSLVKGGSPKVLVPAFVEKGMNDSYRFEFLIYQPDPDLNLGADSLFNVLCDLFYLSSMFRSRILEDWRETFMNLQSLGRAASNEELHRKVRKFRLTFGRLMLEAVNRKVDSPWRIERCFPRKEDQDKLRLILNMENGLYMTCVQQLREGMEANNLSKIIECLDRFKDINKTLLVMSTARLQELATAIDGNLV